MSTTCTPDTLNKASARAAASGHSTARRNAHLTRTGTPLGQPTHRELREDGEEGQLPGYSYYLLKDGKPFLTYMTTARGTRRFCR